MLVCYNENALLCSAIATLLGKGWAVTNIDFGSIIPAAVDNNPAYDVAIIFESYPISRLQRTIKKIKVLATRVLLVLSSNDGATFRSLRDLDIDGVLSIASSYDEFAVALRTVQCKLKYMSPYVLSKVFRAPAQEGLFSNLSPKELDVAYGIMKGKKNIEIAEALNISQKTVCTYKARIFKKLDIEGNVSFMKLAYVNGLLNVD